MNTTLTDGMVEKSIEAFLLAIEIYNKPTIRYRAEGFSFFICNAWELLLKAYIINTEGESEIYYKDNPSRTITITDAMKKVFNNSMNPVRKNLEEIISLRNTSTHFIIEEYEKIYVMLFQPCVSNYCEKLRELAHKNIEDKVSLGFLSLTVDPSDINTNEIKKLHPDAVVNKFIRTREDIIKAQHENENPKFSTVVDHKVYITKKENDADIKVAVSRDANATGVIMKELLDPSNTHNLSHNNVVDKVNEKIRLERINFKHTNASGERNNFNKSDLNLVIKYYNLKNNNKYSYIHELGKSTRTTYTNKLVEFIVSEIKKEPSDYIAKLKILIAKNKI